MWFAGIDWADQHHDVVVIDEAGRKVAQLRVEHTPEGLNGLITFLRELAPLESSKSRAFWRPIADSS